MTRPHNRPLYPHPFSAVAARFCRSRRTNSPSRAHFYIAIFMFNSYLNYSVKNRMRILLGKKSDASLHSSSLGEPITGSDKNEPLTLGDIIPDPDSEIEIVGIIENEYQKQLHAVLDDCLNRLNPAEKETITDHFYRNVSFKAMAEKNGTTVQEELNRFNKGLRKLQHGRTLLTLKTYL